MLGWFEWNFLNCFSHFDAIFGELCSLDQAWKQLDHTFELHPGFGITKGELSQDCQPWNEMHQLCCCDVDTQDKEEEKNLAENLIQDLPPKLLQAILSSFKSMWSTSASSVSPPQANLESIVNLIVSQTKMAILVILNKQDLLSNSEQKLKQLQEIGIGPQSTD